MGARGRVSEKRVDWGHSGLSPGGAALRPSDFAREGPVLDLLSPALHLEGGGREAGAPAQLSSAKPALLADPAGRRPLARSPSSWGTASGTRESNSRRDSCSSRGGSCSSCSGGSLQDGAGGGRGLVPGPPLAGSDLGQAPPFRCRRFLLQTRPRPRPPSPVSSKTITSL